VFIVCDKKVRYSDAKKKELHVFPQAGIVIDSGYVDLHKRVARRSSAGADPERFYFCGHELKMRESFRYPHFLLKFSAQKFASSVNF
jgi:hypothetical protein